MWQMTEQNERKKGHRKWWVSDTKSPGLIVDCSLAVGDDGYGGLQW